MFADFPSLSHTDCEEDSELVEVANKSKRLNKRNEKLKRKIAESARK